MPVEAELFDGTILEFPDGTDEGVISSKAKELTLARQQPIKPPPDAIVPGAIKAGGRMLADLLPSTAKVVDAIKQPVQGIANLLPSTAKVIETVKEPVQQIMAGPGAKLEQIAQPQVQAVTPIDQKPAVGLNRPIADLLPSTAQVAETIRPVTAGIKGIFQKTQPVPEIPLPPQHLLQDDSPIDMSNMVILNDLPGRGTEPLPPLNAEITDEATGKRFGRGLKEGANLGLNAAARLLPFPGIIDATTGKPPMTTRNEIQNGEVVPKKVVDMGALLNPLPRGITDALAEVRGKVGHDTFKLIEDVVMSGAAHGIAPAIRSARTAVNMRRAGPIPEFGEVMDGGLAPGAEAQAMRQGAAARGVQAAQRDALAQRQLPGPEVREFSQTPRELSRTETPKPAPLEIRGGEIRPKAPELPAPAPRPPPRTLRQVNEAEAAKPKVDVFYDDAVKAYTATIFDDRFGNMHGKGDTPAEAKASLDQHLTDAKKNGTWRSVEHPEAAKQLPAPAADSRFAQTKEAVRKEGGFFNEEQLDEMATRRIQGEDATKPGEPLSTEFTKEGDEYGRGMIVHPSTKTPGSWQASAFDKRGFAYDEQFKTRAEAVQFAQTGGMQPTAKDAGKVDQLAKTEDFQKGNEQTRITGMHNELSFKSDNTGAQKVQGIYDAQGFDAAQAFTRERLAKIEAAKAAGQKKPYDLGDAEAAEISLTKRAVEPAPEVPKVKEPWELTREEWNDVYRAAESYKGKAPGVDSIDALDADIKATGLPPGKRSLIDLRKWAEKQPAPEAPRSMAAATIPDDTRRPALGAVQEGMEKARGKKPLRVSKGKISEPLPPRETITPANDTKIGKNAAGEQLYQRAAGDIYRMRHDRKDKPDGYPDFGGDLAPVKKPLQVRKGQILNNEPPGGWTDADKVPTAKRSLIKTPDDEIREIMGLDQRKLDAYDPSKAARKVGRHWSYILFDGKDHPGLYDTKREAIAAATRHAEMKADQITNPSSYYDVSSLRAGKRLEKIKEYESQGMSEMDAGARAREDIPDVEGDKPRKGTIADILKSEKGAIRMGPLRMKRGKPEQAPTVDEAKKMVSALRLGAANWFEESSITLRKTMGEPGTTLGRDAKAVRNDSDIDAGVATQPVRRALKKLNKKELFNVSDVREKKAAPISERVTEAVRVMGEALDKVAEEAQAVGLQITDPRTGEKRPWQPKKDYFPHFFDEKAMDEIRASIQKRIDKETDPATRARLDELLKKAQTRNGHLEISRLSSRQDYIKDPRIVLKYIDDAYERIHIATKFGPELEKGEKLLGEIRRDYGRDAGNFARIYFERVTGTEPEGNTALVKAGQALRNFHVVTKLGQAFIPNLSQPVFTAVHAGALNAARGYAAGLTPSGREFAEKILGDMGAELMLGAGGHRKGPGGGLADLVMKPMQFVEKRNRFGAANAGYYLGQQEFKKLRKHPDSKKHRKELEDMRVDVDAALQRGSLSEMDELRAGQTEVNTTQFRVDATELPLEYTSEYGKLLTQFKSFQFKAGQFVKDEILKEAKKGNFKPFLRAALLFPAAGYLVMRMKDAVRFGEQREVEEDIADYLAQVGTFGAFADAFASTGRQPVRGLQQLAGPTLGDAGALWEAASSITNPRKEDPDIGDRTRPMAKFIAKQTPFVGPSVRQLFNEPKSELAQKKADTDKRLKALGIIKPKKVSREKKLRELGLR
jgi:hypothetical protein